MKRFFLILFLLTVVGGQLSLAQSTKSELKSESKSESKSECETLLSKSYLKSYWSSGLTVLAQPLHYDWKDWTVFGGVAAAATLSFIYDDEIYSFVNNTFTDSQSNTISQYSDVFGEELFIVPSIALTYAISAINKDCRLRNVSLAALQSFIYAEVASAGIKVLTCRTRPNPVPNTPFDSSSPNPVPNSPFDSSSPNPVPNSPFDSPSPNPVPKSQQWLGPFATFESTSFVSGHSMRAFALASTVAGFYPDKTWVRIVSYSLAAATSVGRVISKEHWTSDVIVGAALGYFIGRGVVKFNEKIGNIKNVEIQPIATNYGLGIAVKF